MVKKLIILDTNFLLIPGQFGVDIFEEIDKLMSGQTGVSAGPYELCIVDSTMDELDKIIRAETSSGADKRAATLGKQLLEAKNVRHLKTEKHLNTDKLIVELAKQGDYIVATQDMALKRILKENGVQLIVLRQKKYLKLI